MDESIREDLGYLREVETMSKTRFVVKKRIRYTQGLMKDREATVASHIADDLIEHGMAVEIVGRQPGEEG
jgi:hypothetical protein